MVLTVRLKAEQERLLMAASRRTSRTRSEFVREAVVRYARECLRSAEGTALERLGRWVGAHDSGGRNLSERTGRRYSRLLGARRHERGTR